MVRTTRKTTTKRASSGGRPTRLGGIVKRRREQLGLSMREAARRIGISPSYLFALEQGRNPSTGQGPVPSPPILGSIGRVLDVSLATLFDATGAPMYRSAHLLLYQIGSGLHSPLDAARPLFAGQIDSWIEIIDPRSSANTTRRPPDVLIRKRGPLGRAQLASGVFETTRLLADFADVVAEVRPLKGRRRVGIIFGANSAALRMIENPAAFLQSETTWEQDVADGFKAVLGVEPAANVCVYREADIQELASHLDPLATVLALIQEHPHVAVQDADGAVLTGPAAIETILLSARPAGVSSGTWTLLARAAGVGLAREAATSPPHARAVGT